jgi:cytochrome c5
MAKDVYRIQSLALMVAVAFLFGCSVESENSEQDQSSQATCDYEEGSWRSRYLELGRETYQTACASCHDKGTETAPAIGDRDAWSTRSPLWAAILFEHAKSGYLNMPAKGGKPELTERAVEAAGEFMLCETFPELPRD